MPILFTLNGDQRTSHSPPMTPLVDVLRDEFFLTGAKVVCREGFCGACTVMVDGKAITACLMPVAHVAGAEVQTIESQGSQDALSPVQSWLEQCDAVQCGMCFPGMVMSLTAFLKHTPSPTEPQVKAALCGNICRCTGYERIVGAALALSSATSRSGEQP
ncbi:(2Fe-2S)-binding protein (plasmid) [Diaphorobacter sp. HDW4B]|uniref:(2Fe-2S)-binding protein n=1 Tax=Diaphorobacter sp. HDW4B TaxID=2714925 RepID=UPI00140E60E1|nr:(2Fe-2S)-binding protein [Diaphorobacter sp. HDW4B]QIL74232.1 (2Fe-2S)-binding protein [Diaphorobacter sp. HDW4B]